ncbi:hypothetical protein NXC14_PC00500 (plasmid) [Rhizobium sp. NXC14]|nr:hypothetical protein NXC14_PC00500 [Rhizobium sp. NXC14]
MVCTHRRLVTLTVSPPRCSPFLRRRSFQLAFSRSPNITPIRVRMGFTINAAGQRVSRFARSGWDGGWLEMLKQLQLFAPALAGKASRILEQVAISCLAADQMLAHGIAGGLIVQPLFLLDCFANENSALYF